MEALGGYRTKSSAWKERTLKILISLAVCIGGLYLVQNKLVRKSKPVDFYTFEVLDAKGRTVSLEKYRGKVSTSRGLVGLCCFWRYCSDFFFTSILFIVITHGRNAFIYLEGSWKACCLTSGVFVCVCAAFSGCK